MNIKKVFAVLLAAIVFALIPCEAFAEAPDFSAMTDDELHELIDRARNELKVRECIAKENTVLIDQDDVKVYLTGKYEICEFYYPADLVSIKFETVVINDSNTTISIGIDSSTVNGWDVRNDGISGITAGHKKKGELEFYISEAEITSYEEIEDVILNLYIYDSDNWEVMAHVEPITLHFN